MSKDYEAGNGEDKIYAVISERHPILFYRSKGNACLVAQDKATAGRCRAVVFNTESKEFTAQYDFRLTPTAQAE